ncbi:TetR/AcrR family transcriptional regulator [Streptomyces gamaensis]|uniref:TetR/AcrR family transcriptional regulator n=1 Tax=Streptomyces gamaensis TaxID=1763542 RepID=A0ABW0Z6S5_9ACTN
MPDRQTAILEAAVRVIARSGVRGLRVEELAAEAGVSTALIYYHFKDRAGLVRRTLEFVSHRAEEYTGEELTGDEDPRTELEQWLLMEVQDTARVRENSIAWGELVATSVFDDGLRATLAESTRTWVEDIAELIRESQRAGLADADADPVESAERLTCLIEGISGRWLSGSMPLERARELISGAVDVELGTR